MFIIIFGYSLLVIAIIGCLSTPGQRVLIDSSANTPSQTAPSLDLNIPTIHEVHTLLVSPPLLISLYFQISLFYLFLFCSLFCSVFLFTLLSLICFHMFCLLLLYSIIFFILLSSLSPWSLGLLFLVVALRIYFFTFLFPYLFLHGLQYSKFYRCK